MGAKTVDTSSTSSNSTTPDPNAYASYLAALNRATTNASTPYQPYTGTLTAGVNGAQTNALNGVGAISGGLSSNAQTADNDALAYGNNATGSLAGAQGFAGQLNNNASGSLGAAQGYANTASSLGNVYQPYYDKAAALTGQGGTMLAPQNFASTVNSYMSPYIGDVVNATQGQFNNSNAQQSQSLLSQGIASGNAFGGDRAGVAQGVLAGQQQTSEAPVIAGLYNTGYQQASNEANTAASTALQAGAQYGSLGTGAQAAALAAPTAAAGIMNAGYGTSNSALAAGAGALNAGYNTSNNALAGALQGTQVSNQDMALQQANAQQMFGMGTTIQQTEQARDTANYGQFQNSIAFPYEQTGWLAGLDSAVGPDMGGTSTGSGTATVPAGNVGSSIAGGVTALTGLAGLLKRGGRVGSFAAGGAPGAGTVPSNFPGGDSTWLVPPSIGAASKPFNVQPYQQPNTSGMASSIASGDSQAMGSLGKSFSGLSNSSLGDSISDFTQDAGDSLGGLKRGGSVGHFDTGGTPTPATTTPAASTTPTYSSIADLLGNLTSTMTLGGTTSNIPSPPQLGPLEDETFGSVPQWENDFSKAQGAYYQQYPGAPGDPNGATPTSPAVAAMFAPPGAAGATGTTGGSTAPVSTTTLQVAKRGGSIGHYDDGGDVSPFGDLSGVSDSLAANAAPDANAALSANALYGDLSGVPTSLAAAQYASQMPPPNQMLQSAVANAPAIDVARNDMAAANGSLGSYPTVANDNGGSLGSAPIANDNVVPAPQAATGTYGSLAAVPQSIYGPPISMSGAAGPIGSVNPSLIQSGATPEALQADAFNQPGVTRYADGTVTGPGSSAPLAPSYVPPSSPGSLASSTSPASYPGAGGSSMYTGPVHLASTGTSPIVSGSIAAPVATPQTAAAVQTAAPASGGSGFLASLKHFESGNSNIPNVHEGTSSGQAQGYDQITTGTWADFAPKAGVDLKQYPTPMSAPQSVQDAVAKNIPMGRWAPETLNYLESKGYVVDKSKTLGENIAANGDAPPASVAAVKAAAPGSLGSAPSDETPSSPQVIAQRAAIAPSTGGLLDGLGIHLSKDASLALMSAGFGMMASRSPFFAQGIGEGAQKGVQTYMAAQNLDRQNVLAGAQIGHLNAETGLTNTQAETAKQALDIQKSVNKQLFPSVFGTPTAPVTSAPPIPAAVSDIQKSVASNIKSTPPAPTDTVPVAPAQSKQTIPDDQNPPILRAQAAALMQRAQLLAMSPSFKGAADEMRAQAQMKLDQANKLTESGRISVPSDGGGYTITNAPGDVAARATQSGATATAEQQAKSATPLGQSEINRNNTIMTPGGPIDRTTGQPIAIGGAQPAAQPGDTTSTQPGFHVPVPTVPKPQGYYAEGPNKVYMAQAEKDVEGTAASGQAAMQTKGLLGELQNDMKTIPKDDFLSSGTGLAWRQDFAKAANTAAQITGAKMPFDPDKVASNEQANKIVLQLGVAINKGLGREPGYILDKLTGAQPGTDITPQGRNLIMSGLRATAQSAQDQADFTQNFMAQNGHTMGAQAAFNQAMPEDRYVHEASVIAKIPQTMVDKLRADPTLAPQFDAAYGPAMSRYFVQ